MDDEDEERKEVGESAAQMLLKGMTVEEIRQQLGKDKQRALAKVKKLKKELQEPKRAEVLKFYDQQEQVVKEEEERERKKKQDKGKTKSAASKKDRQG